MTTKKDEERIDVDDSTASWAWCVRELLRRHNVDRRKYSHVVGEILGLEYVAGYRRVSGKHPWRADEIDKMAKHFGETAAQVLEPVLAQGTEPAVLLIGTMRVKCDVILGEALTPPFTQQLVAIGGLETWLIVPSANVTLPAREVRKVILSLSTPAAGSASTQGSPDDGKP